MKKQLRLFYTSIIYIIISVYISFSSAYLTDTHNIIKELNAGHVNIEIWEEGELPESIDPLTAGYDYNVRFVNTGNIDIFLRVSFDLSDDRLKDYIEFTNLGEHEGWTDIYCEDGDSLYGYYYYTQVLIADEASSALFDSIDILSGLTEELAQQFEVNMYAEAIAAEDYENYEEAWEAITEME